VSVDVVIPVLASPVISRLDLLRAMLASIDEEVETLIVVDNSLGALGPMDDLDVKIIRPPLLGLGCVGAWNAAMAQTPGAPWWLLATSDIQFGRGDLRAIWGLMTDATDPVTLGGRGFFAVNAAAVAAIGLWDEWTFYPAYFEDNDWFRRCRLGGVRWVDYGGEVNHLGSMTIRSDPALAQRNHVTFSENKRRYVEKWGGLPNEETYATPWNLPVPLSFVRPDLAGRQLRRW
jgi:hypothetical protein